MTLKHWVSRTEFRRERPFGKELCSNAIWSENRREILCLFVFTTSTDDAIRAAKYRIYFDTSLTDFFPSGCHTILRPLPKEPTSRLSWPSKKLQTSHPHNHLHGKSSLTQFMLQAGLEQCNMTCGQRQRRLYNHFQVFKRTTSESLSRSWSGASYCVYWESWAHRTFDFFLVQIATDFDHFTVLLFGSNNLIYFWGKILKI